MIVNELISLFGRPLPLSPTEIIARLESKGIAFDIDDSSRSRVSGRFPYDPERHAEVVRLVDEFGWDVEVVQQVWADFDDAEYASAPLLVASFDEIWIDEAGELEKCSICEKSKMRAELRPRIRRIKSRKPILCVNSHGVVVSNDVRHAIEEQLTGAEFQPYDDEGRYSLLGARTDLGPFLHWEEDMVDYLGLCEECGRHQFNNYFGPLRFERSRWSGHDIVNESFYGDLLFSQKAFQLLQSFDSSIYRWRFATLH